MFRHAQLESVKAWLGDPAHQALPRHVRIQRAIRQLILDGALDAGRPLPASRALARSLGVSRDTVEAAYGQLHAEGFIERRVGSGSFVSAQALRVPRQPPSSRPGQPAAAALSQRGSTMLAGGGVRESLTARPFAPGIPETRNFPLAVWERLQRQVLKEHGARALAHCHPQGMESLRQAIADYINLERGARATPERILVLTSSQQALSLCAMVLLDVGERICVEDPVYHGARKAFDAAGLDCVPIPLDGDGMQVGHLDAVANARAVFLTPSHQFPSGTTLSLARRLGVIDWARRQQAWIIEDDYDSEFHYAGKPTACVQGLDDEQRTIYIGTFTKSLFPGLRIAYMLLPPALVAPMTVARSLQDGHNATIAQLTLARFIEGGHFGAHVRAMRSVYAARRDRLARLVDEHLGDFVTAEVPAGGMQMPCFLRAGIDEAPAVAAAQRAGIELLGLSPLSAGGGGCPGFLMGFAAYTPEEMAIALRQLAAVLQGLTAK